MCTVKNVGFVAARLGGTDGVSLEAAKWVGFFEKKLNKSCFYCGGELQTDPKKSLFVREAAFNHPAIKDIERNSFEPTVRDPLTTFKIHKLKTVLKRKLHEFIAKFDIHMLVAENVLAIPMNIPLGLALTEVISETGIPTIAHHHDFFWERQRFLANCVWEYLNMAFPPHMPFVHHVVINSSADNQLSLRTGISPKIIPNVIDFGSPSPPPDEYSKDLRETLGIAPDEIFVLQPTRIVKRKGIEHAVELVRRLGWKAVLVISHASGDEGNEYEKRLREYSKILGVRTLFVSELIAQGRGRASDGRKIYALSDVYPHADLVTYPSTYEGFGNAFLEAIYYKKPIVVNSYSIYTTDIKPKGFETIELNGYVTEEVLKKTRMVLSDPRLRKRMAEKNYQLGLRYYSYNTLYKRLQSLMDVITETEAPRAQTRA